MNNLPPGTQGEHANVSPPIDSAAVMPVVNKTPLIEPFERKGSIHPALIEKSSFTGSEVRDLPTDPDSYSDVVRGGVIPYTNHNKVRSYCLGVDRKSGDISAFMGKIIGKDSSVAEGCLREWKEESLEVFSHCKQRKVVAMHTKKMLIIFVLLSVNPRKATEAFRARVRDKPDSEMKDLVWLNHDQFKAAIWAGYDGSVPASGGAPSKQSGESPSVNDTPAQNYVMYDRVRDFLRSAFHRKKMYEMLS